MSFCVGTPNQVKTASAGCPEKCIAALFCFVFFKDMLTFITILVPKYYLLIHEYKAIKMCCRLSLISENLEIFTFQAGLEECGCVQDSVPGYLTS